MTTIEKLAAKWGVDADAVDEILNRMDIKRWLGGETLDSISHADTIDDGATDMTYGHNGYWVSDGENIAIITNGDPLWSTLTDEDACSDAGLFWGDLADMLEGHEI